MSKYRIKEPMPQYGANTARIVDVPDEVVKQIRADAIDEFATKICEILEKCQTGFNMVSMANIWLISRELAEELKAGGKNE